MYLAYWGQVSYSNFNESKDWPKEGATTDIKKNGMTAKIKLELSPTTDFWEQFQLNPDIFPGSSVNPIILKPDSG